ncbi:MAG: cadmium resistance transporter, partial [Clostridiaceae bacterium]|nr:cadmium resistance transporter [Clostridiaceae bacterium]
MISIVITAFVSFVSTNIDDIFVLMLFFTQINNVIKTRHIVIGQYLGIGVLTAISIIGALGVSVVPHEYVGFLGLVPIYLGIKEYVDHKKESKNDGNTGQQALQNGENSKLEEPTNTQVNRIMTFIK